MSYSPEKSLTITVRVTPKQRKMLEKLSTDRGESLSVMVREILEREHGRLKRRAVAGHPKVPTRRP